MNRTIAAPSISVVIPTIGRPCLTAAVESALRQTVSPIEVIVVMDGEGEVNLARSSSVIVTRTAGRQGAAVARQVGIDTATGAVIALLDDDDVWHENKLELQLAATPDSSEWILSCRIRILRPGKRPAVFPRELIRDGQPVFDYLYGRHALRFGGSSMQTSTLVFPRRVAQAVPWSTVAGSEPHDDPEWLAEVQRVLPQVKIVQIPDTLVDYGLTGESLSRSAEDRSADHIAWALSRLTSTSPRVLGDYLLTEPVSSAVSAGSFRGLRRSINAGVRHGRPGGWAWAYAGAAIFRIGLRRFGGLVAQTRQRGLPRHVREPGDD